MLKVRQIQKNQFLIGNDFGVIFQSYNTLIAGKTYIKEEKNGVITKKRKIYLLKDAYNFSITTSKYLRIFLEDFCFFKDGRRKAIEQEIKKGNIETVETEEELWSKIFEEQKG